MAKEMEDTEELLSLPPLCTPPADAAAVVFIVSFNDEATIFSASARLPLLRVVSQPFCSSSLSLSLLLPLPLL